MEKKNILITGGTLSQNHGAEAMTLVTIQILKDVLINPNIFLASNNNQDRKKAKKYNIKFIKIPNTILGRTKLLLIGFLMVLLKKKPENKFLRVFYESDLIIDISGDAFGDYYHLLNMLSIGWRQLLILLFKKPLVLFPQSMGPFTNFTSKLIAKMVLNYSKIILIREKISLVYIKKFINRSNNIFFCLDAAFYLKISTEKTIYDNFFEKDMRDFPIIGIAASQLISSEKYIKIFSNFSNHLINIYNHNIVLIPHVIDTIKNINDDRIVLKKIYQNIDNKEKCLLIERDLDAPVLKNLIGKCDIFIGSRMHSNIASISSNVPTIAISYSHKYSAIMNLFEQGEYVLNVNNLNFNKLLNSFNKIFDQRYEIINKLKYFNLKYQKYKKVLKNTVKKAIEIYT